MTRVFNLFIPLPSFINELSPTLAREAMTQISNAVRIHKLNMVTSFSTATGFTGTVGILIWSKALLEEGVPLESNRRYDWIFQIRKSWGDLNPTECIFSFTAIIISIIASVVFFSNFMEYRSLQRFQVLYFSKLERIATTR